MATKVIYVIEFMFRLKIKNKFIDYVRFDIINVRDVCVDLRICSVLNQINQCGYG